ncbi:hypothetical protein KY316_02645 [Candidatus Woesearchaeota archaeon]|nr:hypothetical protein [Candidatus Woesearchaeota archaeon]
MNAKPIALLFLLFVVGCGFQQLPVEEVQNQSVEETDNLTGIKVIDGPIGYVEPKAEEPEPEPEQEPETVQKLYQYLELEDSSCYPFEFSNVTGKVHIELVFHNRFSFYAVNDSENALKKCRSRNDMSDYIVKDYGKSDYFSIDADTKYEYLIETFSYALKGNAIISGIDTGCAENSCNGQCYSCEGNNFCCGEKTAWCCEPGYKCDFDRNECSE